MTDTVVYAILAGVLGAVFASFLGVVVDRLPRGESLVHPGSHCNVCMTPVRPYDNVPVLGWIVLRGRCRACGAPIPKRYPLLEAATAALCVAVVLTRSSAVGVALGLLLVLTVLPAALIDLDHHRIPNWITGPAAVLALVLGSALGWGGEAERLIAGAAAGGFLLIAALAYPRGMGMGDVKLAAVIGLILGRAVAAAMVTALVAGVIIGIVVIARAPADQRRQAGVPFGPFLAFGALVGLLAGSAIVNAYLHHLA
jgi:leader peptidase (prepilin peptidase)/N-methyltransferase